MTVPAYTVMDSVTKKDKSNFRQIGKGVKALGKSLACRKTERSSTWTKFRGRKAKCWKMRQRVSIIENRNEKRMF